MSVRTVHGAVAAAVVCALSLTAAAPAHAVTRHAVTMTLSGPTAAVLKGTAVTVTGRASAGSTGNAATVDIYLGYVREASVHASGSGAFQGMFTATTSGTVKAIYRGNAARGTATRSFALHVYRLQAASKVVFTHTVDTGVCEGGEFLPGRPGGFPDSCFFKTEPTPIAAGAVLHYVWATTARGTASISMTVGYAPDLSHQIDTSPQWRYLPDYRNADLSAPGPVLPDLDLTPGITDGCLIFESTGSITWSVTVTETYQRRVAV